MTTALNSRAARRDVRRNRRATPNHASLFLLRALLGVSLLQTSTQSAAAGATLPVGPLPPASPCCLIAPPVIAPTLREQDLPSIRREETVPQTEVSTPSRPDAERIITDQLLPSAISQVVVNASLLMDEIKMLLVQFIGKNRVSDKVLEQVREEIEEMVRQRGRLAQVTLSVIPGTGAEDGSTLLASIHEISVRTVRVEQDGGTDLPQALLDEILADTKADLDAGRALDLDRLDSRLKQRMSLKDVTVRAALIPVDPNHVDVNVLVRAAPVEPAGWLAQYDNNGLRAYGRERFTAGVSIPGTMLSGDQTDALALTSSGMTYGRVAYEFPLVAAGARINIWSSRVNYRVPSATHGNATLVGTGLTFPLQINSVSAWTGTLNYVHRHEADRLANDTPSADKTTRSVQGKIDARYFPSQSRTLHFTTAWTLGDLDLSALASAAAQDQNSARTAGGFAKLEWNAGWNAWYGPSGKFDAGIEVKGQFASKNLDQSDKFALGGPLGIRAYNSAEALGDEGHVTSVDLGYRPIDRLRIYGFYDIGRTRLAKQRWAPGSMANQYTLQGAGVGMTYTGTALVGSAILARQIGANPGLSAAGSDADGSSRRSRLWLSLTWRR